jgi:hypothetical protein
MELAGGLVVLLHQVFEERGMVVEAAETEFGRGVPAATPVTSHQRGETRTDAPSVGQLSANLLGKSEQQ